MKEIKLHPLKGIELENGYLVPFGATKSQVLAILGPLEDTEGNRLFFDEWELRVDFDQAGAVEFIEFIYGPFPKKVALEIYELNPFQTLSYELINILSEKNKGEIDEGEAPYCYTFLETSIGIYRESCEEDIEQMIKEMKANNEYANNEEWVKEDLEKSRYFWTIGIGKEGYYKN